MDSASTYLATILEPSTALLYHFSFRGSSEDCEAAPTELLHYCSDKRKLCPGWCGSVDWVPACEPNSGRFDSQSGHMPGLQARSPVGGMQETTTHWCFSPSFPSPLLGGREGGKRKKKRKERRKERKLWCPGHRMCSFYVKILLGKYFMKHSSLLQLPFSNLAVWHYIEHCGLGLRLPKKPCCLGGVDLR